MSSSLVVSGGGTAGHVYPALTVLDTVLGRKDKSSTIMTLPLENLLWIGSRGGMEEELVQRAGIKYLGLAAGGLRGMGVFTSLRNAILILKSTFQARGILKRFRPGVVFVTGGYACVAVTLAAWTLRIPSLVYLPDVVPGLAIRFLGRFAARVAVTSEESYHYFRREKVFVSGYPVRANIYEFSKAEARRALNLDPDKPTLLVFGGSRGARSINRALVASLNELLPVCQIIHISGRLDADWVAGAAKRLPEDLKSDYHHYAYLHEMPYALVSSDLAVTRAGASTLGEFPAAGLPSVLVPYPYSGQHQEPNARYMAENGAAIVLPDEELAERLAPTVLDLLNDPETLRGMRESARAMARPDAANMIASELWSLVKEPEARSRTSAKGADGRSESS